MDYSLTVAQFNLEIEKLSAVWLRENKIDLFCDQLFQLYLGMSQNEHATELANEGLRFLERCSVDERILGNSRFWIAVESVARATNSETMEGKLTKFIAEKLPTAPLLHSTVFFILLKPYDGITKSIQLAIFESLLKTAHFQGSTEAVLSFFLFVDESKYENEFKKIIEKVNIEYLEFHLFRTYCNYYFDKVPWPIERYIKIKGAKYIIKEWLDSGKQTTNRVEFFRKSLERSLKLQQP